MMKKLLLAFLLVSCHDSRPPCDDHHVMVQLKALEQLHTAAALGVIAAGKCDAYKGRPVEQCPAYAAIETSFVLSAEGLERSCR